MDRKQKYISKMYQYWYSMFPDGYVGDGVYISDLNLEADYDSATDEEINEVIND